jgi:hypothetical protein
VRGGPNDHDHDDSGANHDDDHGAAADHDDHDHDSRTNDHDHHDCGTDDHDHDHDDPGAGRVCDGGGHLSGRDRPLRRHERVLVLHGRQRQNLLCEQQQLRRL